MDLNEFKSEWQKPNQSSFGEDELNKMAKLESQSMLLSVRRKLIIEAIGLTVFLFIYYDGFDGHSKPVYANVLLVTSLLLYITNNIFSYLFIKNPVEGPNLKLSLQIRMNKLKRIFAFSMVSSMIYATTLLLFFTSSVKWSAGKYYVVALLILISSILFYFSFLTWKKKIAHFNQLLIQLDENR
jgi:hypothetical protein